MYYTAKIHWLHYNLKRESFLKTRSKSLIFCQIESLCFYSRLFGFLKLKAMKFFFFFCAFKYKQKPFIFSSFLFFFLPPILCFPVLVRRRVRFQEEPRNEISCHQSKSLRPKLAKDFIKGEKAKR